MFPTDRVAADADRVGGGVLLDFKSTPYPRTLRQAEAWQLLGCLRLDIVDPYHNAVICPKCVRFGIRVKAQKNTCRFLCPVQI
ncbi:hypothetical protein [Streptomyces tauricus]